MTDTSRAPWRTPPAGPFELADICKHLGLPVPEGQGAVTFTDIKPLYSADKFHLSFLDNQLYKHGARTTQAGAVMVRPEDAESLPEGTIALVTKQPYVAFAAALQLFYPRENPEPGRNQTAQVAETATLHPTARLEPGVLVYPGASIGARAHIGAYTIVGEGVQIGAGTVVGPHCTLQKCSIGENCIFHPGVAIGQDGFGFAMMGERILKVPQVGGVIIGNEVELGAHTTVDCGALEDTIIEDMVKIDNHVQIGHNVKIGKGTRIVAQVGIAGSASIGEYNVIGGQSGIVGHISTAKGVMLAAYSGLTKTISEPGSVFAGAPAQPIREWKRELAILSRMVKGFNKKTVTEPTEMTKSLYTREQIQDRLPHRAPILLLDEVLEYTPEKTLTAQRHFKADDPLFNGHFPGNPILPGVMVCEAIAQAGALLVALDKDLHAEQATYLFAGLNNVRFSTMVRPGDTLLMTIEKKVEKLGVFKFSGIAMVGNNRCAQAEFTAKLVLNNQMALGL